MSRYQHYGLFSLRDDTPTPGAALSGAGSSADRTLQLEQKLQRLSLITNALWEIVREREQFPEDLLALKVAELDMQDGKLDGRVVTPPSSCPKCQRVIQSGSQKCVYCGELVTNANVFRGI